MQVTSISTPVAMGSEEEFWLQVKHAQESAREWLEQLDAETPEERKARERKEQAELLEERNEQVRGRDLVAEVLSHPDPCQIPDIHIIRDVLFNRSACGTDEEEETIQRMTNGAYDHVFHGDLTSLAALPDGANKMPASLDAWKFVYCDKSRIEEGKSINEIYEARLQDEELQSPEELARERIRTDVERAARRNAKWVIPVLERLSPQELCRMDREEEDGASLAVWKQVSPPPPAWVQHIADTQQAWGFVFYKAPSVQAQHGRRWKRVWERIRDRTYHIAMESRRDSPEASLMSIHCRGNMSLLQQLWTENWAAVPNHNIVSDDAALRRHFREYRETLSSPGILRNTFLVVDPAPITRDLLSEDGSNYELFWLWAYDADWEPTEPTEKDTAPNGEVYQGRMKVLISCLDAWFYAARWEGVSLRDLWRKAQNCRENVWICYTNSREAWKHEPYV